MKKLAFTGLLGFAQAINGVDHHGQITPTEMITGASEWEVTTKHHSSTADSDLYQVTVLHDRDYDKKCEKITNEVSLNKGNEIPGPSTVVAWAGDCGTEGTHGFEFVSDSLEGLNNAGDEFTTKFCVKASRQSDNYGKLQVDIGLKTTFQTDPLTSGCVVNSSPQDAFDTADDAQEAVVAVVAGTFELQLTNDMNLEALAGGTPTDGITLVQLGADTEDDKQTEAKTVFDRTFQLKDKRVQDESYIKQASRSADLNSYEATMIMGTNSTYSQYEGAKDDKVAIGCKYVANTNIGTDHLVHIECKNPLADTFKLPFDHAHPDYFGSDDCVSGLCTGAVSVDMTANSPGLVWGGAGIEEFATSSFECSEYTFTTGDAHEFGESIGLSSIYTLGEETGACKLSDTLSFTAPDDVTGCTNATWLAGTENLNHTKHLYDQCIVAQPGTYIPGGETLTIGEGVDAVSSGPLWVDYKQFGFVPTNDNINLDFTYSATVDGEKSIPLSARTEGGVTRTCVTTASTDSDITKAQEEIQNWKNDIDIEAQKIVTDGVMKAVKVTEDRFAGHGRTGPSRCDPVDLEFKVACTFTDVTIRNNKVGTETANSEVKFTLDADTQILTVPAYTPLSSNANANRIRETSHDILAGGALVPPVPVTGLVYDNVPHDDVVLTMTSGDGVTTFNCFDDPKVNVYTNRVDLPCQDSVNLVHTTKTYIRYTAAQLTVTAQVLDREIKERSGYADIDSDTTKTVRFTSTAITADLAASHDTGFTAVQIETHTDGPTMTIVPDSCQSNTDPAASPPLYSYDCILNINGEIDNIEGSADSDKIVKFTAKYGHHTVDECQVKEDSPDKQDVDVSNSDTVTFKAEPDKFGGKIEITDTETDEILTTDSVFEQRLTADQILDSEVSVKVDAAAHSSAEVMVKFYRDTNEGGANCNPTITIPTSIDLIRCERTDGCDTTTTDQPVNVTMPIGSSEYYVVLKTQGVLDNSKNVEQTIEEHILSIKDCAASAERKVKIRIEMANPASDPYYKRKLDNAFIKMEAGEQDLVIGTNQYKRWNTVELQLQHFTVAMATAEQKEFKFNKTGCQSQHFTPPADGSADENGPAVAEWTSTKECVNYGRIAVEFEDECYKFKVKCQRHARDITLIDVDLDYSIDFSPTLLKLSDTNTDSTAAFGASCTSADGVTETGVCKYVDALAGLQNITKKFEDCGKEEASSDDTNMYTMNMVQSKVNLDSYFCSIIPLKLTVKHSGSSTAIMTIATDIGFEFEFTLEDFGLQNCTDVDGAAGHQLIFKIKDEKTDNPVSSITDLKVNGTLISDTWNDDDNDDVYNYASTCHATNYCQDTNTLDFDFVAMKSTNGQDFYADVGGDLSIAGNPCLAANTANKDLDALLEVGHGTTPTEDGGECKNVPDADYGTESQEVKVQELGCFKLSKINGAIGKLNVTDYVLKRDGMVVSEADKGNYIIPSKSTDTLTEDTVHYFTMDNLRDLAGETLSLTVSWEYVDLGGSNPGTRRLRHETYFLGSANPHATVGMKILPASVQVAEQLETAGMSSDIAASETTDETDTAPAPEPLATESTAATTSVGVWVGVGVGSLVVVMLVVVYVQRANQVGIAGGPATGSTKYRGYKKVDSLRFSSNIAF